MADVKNILYVVQPLLVPIIGLPESHRNDVVTRAPTRS
jgi:hypothetical protein